MYSELGRIKLFKNGVLIDEIKEGNNNINAIDYNAQNMNFNVIRLNPIMNKEKKENNIQNVIDDNINEKYDELEIEGNI